MRHVGDMNVEVEAAVGALAGAHRVIEVACVGRVDGHAHDVAQVAAARIGGEGAFHVGAHGLGLGKRRRREVAGQAMARDDGLDVHVELVGRADTAVERHDGGRVGRGVLDDARGNDVARRDPEALGALVLGNDEEVVAKPVVERDNRAERARELEAAEQRVGGAVYHRVDDGELALAGTLGADEKDADLVSAHGLAYAGAGDVEGALGGLDHGRAGAQDAQDADECAALLARPLGGAAAGVSMMRALSGHRFSPLLARAGWTRDAASGQPVPNLLRFGDGQNPAAASGQVAAAGAGNLSPNGCRF